MHRAQAVSSALGVLRLSPALFFTPLAPADPLVSRCSAGKRFWQWEAWRRHRSVFCVLTFWEVVPQTWIPSRGCVTAASTDASPGGDVANVERVKDKVCFFPAL